MVLNEMMIFEGISFVMMIEVEELIVIDFLKHQSYLTVVDEKKDFRQLDDNDELKLVIVVRDVV